MLAIILFQFYGQVKIVTIVRKHILHTRSIDDSAILFCILIRIYKWTSKNKYEEIYTTHEMYLIMQRFSKFFPQNQNLDFLVNVSRYGNKFR